MKCDVTSCLLPTLLLPVMLLLHLVSQVAALGNEGLYFDLLGANCQALRLQCQVEVPSSYGDVVSITIFNATDQRHKVKLAYVSTGNQPTSASQGSLRKSVYLSGGVAKAKHKNPVLRILLLQYTSYIDQIFVCDVNILIEGTDIETRTWNVTVNKTVETTPAPQPAATTTTQTSDNAAKIGAIQDGESSSFLDTDSLPMTVLIVMLVLISIVLFIAVFLLMHRYRSRCLRREEDMYRPPAYCLAPDHHLDWSDNGSTLKSKGSARTLNSRSHYSFAARNMPLPAIPVSATTGRRSRNSTSRRPPSVSSSVKVQYIQPQDAIGQESSEDGEIAALSSGSPTVHYKTPRDRDRHSRQNSPLYACVPVSDE